LADLLYGTQIRIDHSNNFIVGYDRLLELAKECDTDHIIQDGLLFAAHGPVEQAYAGLTP